MDPKRVGLSAMLALPREPGGGAGYSFPSSGAGATMSAPGQTRRPGSAGLPGLSGLSTPSSFPSVDEHLVKPEVTRDELIRGRGVIAMPALPPHADRQAALAGLIAWSVQPAYIPAVDLLTRVADKSNFATDVSIRRAGSDPATGERYLEEVSFEVVNEQSMRDIREKAEDLIARGVRRFFAIFVKRNEVAEWSAAVGDFVKLGLDEEIVDPSLLKPIAVRALLDKAAAEVELVKVLEQKKSPGIEAMKERATAQGRDEGRDEGRHEMLREAVEKALRMRFGSISKEDEARIAAAPFEELVIWFERLFLAKTANDVFSG